MINAFMVQGDWLIREHVISSSKQSYDQLNHLDKYKIVSFHNFPILQGGQWVNVV